MAMAKIIIALAFTSCVSAFVPVTPDRYSRSVTSSAVNVEDMIGVGPETGNVVWDPLSFGSVSKRNGGYHDSFMPDVQWLREAELKHGRASMLAFVGTCFAANGIVFPGDLGGFHYEKCAWYDGLASGFSTNSFGMAQLLLTIGLIEGTSFPAGFWTGEGTREPGDLGFYPFGNAEKNNRDMKELQISELKNGRLAMIAMAGFFAQHQLPGSVPLLDGAPI